MKGVPSTDWPVDFRLVVINNMDGLEFGKVVSLKWQIVVC